VTIDVAELKTRGLRGTRWQVIASAIGLPLAYFTSLLLGRTSPEALGAYALSQIFVGVVLTFSVIGGEMPLRNFVPKQRFAEERGRLYVSYLSVALLAGFVLLLVMTLPGVARALLGEEEIGLPLGILVFFGLLVVLGESLMGLVAGLLHLKTVALARQIIRYVTFPTIGLSLLFFPQLFREHPLPIVFGAAITSYLLIVLFLGREALRDPAFHPVVKWGLPKGFIAFTLTNQVSALAVFLNTQFDRLAVLRLENMAGLGVYQATISLVVLIDYVPRMISHSTLPLFSSLHANGQSGELRRGYQYLHRLGSIGMVLISLPVICFSAPLLDLFGKGYSVYFALLTAYAVTTVITSPYLVNTPLLWTLERNSVRLAVSGLQFVIQLVGTVLLIQPFGVAGIAGAKIASVILSQLFALIYVHLGLHLGLRISRAYVAGAAVAVLTGVVRVFILPTGILASAGLFIGALAIFTLTAGITPAEVQETFLVLIGRKRPMLEGKESR
jgi:O-antigen/teichoic acid export membrane protein